MKMNKKGFTLIELLAVIVILAVIALIAVPQVLRILNQARQSAAEDSAYGALEAAESFVAEYMLQNQGDWVNDVTITCANSECTAVIKNTTTPVNITVNGTASNKLNIKGTSPKDGVIELSTDGTATIKSDARLHINNYYCGMTSSKKVKCATTSNATLSD